MNPSQNHRVTLPSKGFALIVTLALMTLVTVSALGLILLSTVSMKTASSHMAREEARGNAKLAIQLAIGQLQSSAGHDTRITAGSAVLDPSKPTVTGAWRSWEGSDHDATGKPVIPAYASKKSTGNPHQLPGSAVSGRFLGWLTSTTANTLPDVTRFPGMSNIAMPGYVPMVAAGSSADPTRQVHLKPTMINASKGAFAWWTSGENSKAMINTDRGAKPTTIVGWQQRVRSNGRADAKVFGLGDLDTYAAGKCIPSADNLRLVNPAAELRKIHDLTTYNRGLLTNSATGGWRKDLSLMSEQFASLPSSGLPFFTLSPGKDQKYSKAQLGSTSGSPLLYPWANYRNNANGAPWEQVPPICSWSALVDFTQLYSKLAPNGSAARTSMDPAFAIGSHGDPNQRLEFQDKVRRVPQVARVHWIYSIGSRPVPGAVPIRYNPGILVTPVLTLWNPYNVEVSVGNFGLNIQETAPMRFKLKVAGTALPEVSLSDISRAGTEYTRFNLRIDNTITLAPGATRIFSTTEKIPVINAAASDVKLTPGFKPGGGVLFTYIYKSPSGMAEIAMGSTNSFEVDKISYDAVTTEGGRDGGSKTGFGIIYDIVVNSQSMAAHRMIYDTNELGGATVVSALYPPLTKKISARVSSIDVVNATAGSIPSMPFASAMFGYRMASPPPRDSRLKHLFSKGMLQANPLCFYTEIGFGDDTAAVSSMAGTGVYHPINAPYDFAFQEMNGWNDTMAGPQWEASSGSSYIVSGLTPGDGLTRCVMAELPTRPLQSLAELQHFDARNNNPIPPFQFNLLGNGSANPIFAPSQISIATAFNNGMCNDDTYILNHLFFDDWFVSSITREPGDFNSATKRTMQSVYQDHLTRATPLANRFYLPAPGAGIPGPAEAATAAMATSLDSKTGKYPFETIASKLEVEGMFNINSVSLEAWKAILRQSRDLHVPYLAANGSTNAGNASSFAYPRTSIAGDQGSDSGSNESNAAFPAAAEFSGYRVLTDVQIDALAEEIVKEIQKRGPFLSLAEFVNRQLSTTEDLAIASTIQKALDNLAAMGASPKNPFAAIQVAATEITGPPPGNTDYKFPQAALGSSAFGVPGWVRQADILKALAPILSVRDDTFIIRTYGDARDKSNPTRIRARAWCEVVVKREADYLDPMDSAGVAPFSPQMKSPTNKRYGRKYKVVSFRWLDEAEI